MKLDLYIHPDLYGGGYNLSLKESFGEHDQHRYFSAKVSRLNDPPYTGCSIDMEIVPNLIKYLQKMVNENNSRG
jgi:hypothetical protein